MSPEPTHTLHHDGGDGVVETPHQMTATSVPPKNNHPHLVRIDWQEGSHASCLRAVKAFKQGEILCDIEGTMPGPKKWSSVQVGPGDHIELCSDLLYMNHSCDPNVFVDVALAQAAKSKTNGTGAADGAHGRIGTIRVLRDIEPEDPISFFYPCTEWDMDQPFQCHCGSKNCLGYIQGAKMIPPETLSRYRVNKHIEEAKRAQQ